MKAAKDATDNQTRATGVHENTVKKIWKNGPTPPKRRGPRRKRVQDSIDNFDRGVLETQYITFL